MALVSLRRAHGNGASALLRSERRPLDEVPAMNAEDTERGLEAARVRGRPFTPGNAAAKNRKPSLASVGGMPVDAQDAEYKKCLGWARRYRARRVRELTVAHGGELSAGVCAMLTSSALDMAASRYMTSLGARTSDPAMMVTASRLAQSSRQQELTALDMAEREASARAKSAGPVDPLAAWRTPPAGGTR